MPRKSGVFKFRKHDSIGYPAAEQDAKFLRKCFVDTGDLDVLLDLESPKAVIRGRTGAGKSALLSKVQTSDNEVVSISPDQLAFNYITSASYIVELEGLGINLTPFYKFLWRHVIAVEVFRYLYPDGENGNIFTRLLDAFRRSPNEKKAIEYLKEYSGQYWLNEQSVTREIIKHNEKEFTGSLEAETAGKLIGCGPTASAGLAAKYSTTERNEIERIGREWISRSQTPLLSVLPSLLDKILDDEGRMLYIAIDGLDESWVEDQLRYKLLRSLLGNVRDYNHHVKNLKILIALRQDLWTTIFRETQEKGHQEEKTGSLALDVTWGKSHLLEIMERRISTLVKDQYTNATIGFDDIFPLAVAFGRTSGKEKTSAIDYIIARTWLRPRDVIEFVNLCIQNAQGKSTFNKTILQAAERLYSESRFRSLIEEWQETYPGIEHFIHFLRSRPRSFSLADIADNELEQLAMDSACRDNPDCLTECSRQFMDANSCSADYKRAVAELLYSIGAIGLKTDPHLETHWRHINNHVITRQDIPDEARVAIHPALHRHLGCHV